MPVGTNPPVIGHMRHLLPHTLDVQRRGPMLPLNVHDVACNGRCQHTRIITHHSGILLSNCQVGGNELRSTYFP